MKLLAIDQSLKRTAVSIGNTRSCYSEWETFNNHGKDKKTPLPQMLLNFAMWFGNLLDEEQPQQVVMESPVCHGQGGSIAALIGLSTLIQVECQMREIPCHAVHPTTLKKLYTGNGAATKEDVQKMTTHLFKHYDASVDDGFDVSDSLALMWVWEHCQEELTAPKPKRKRRKKV